MLSIQSFTTACLCVFQLVFKLHNLALQLIDLFVFLRNLLLLTGVYHVELLVLVLLLGELALQIFLRVFWTIEVERGLLVTMVSAIDGIVVDDFLPFRIIVSSFIRR